MLSIRTTPELRLSIGRPDGFCRISAAVWGMLRVNLINLTASLWTQREACTSRKPGHGEFRGSLLFDDCVRTVLRVPVTEGRGPDWGSAMLDEELRQRRLTEARDILEQLKRRDPEGGCGIVRREALIRRPEPSLLLFIGCPASQCPSAEAVLLLVYEAPILHSLRKVTEALYSTSVSPTGGLMLF